jgi:hypothetical protein
MNGVLTHPEWEVYEYTAGEGIVTFDPVAQLESAAPDDAHSDGKAPEPD